MNSAQRVHNPPHTQRTPWCTRRVYALWTLLVYFDSELYWTTVHIWRHIPRGRRVTNYVRMSEEGEEKRLREMSRHIIYCYTSYMIIGDKKTEIKSYRIFLPQINIQCTEISLHMTTLIRKTKKLRSIKKGVLQVMKIDHKYQCPSNMATFRHLFFTKKSICFVRNN